MINSNFIRLRYVFAIIACSFWGFTSASGQLLVALTDRIHRGSGEIDLLKDIGGADLASLLNQDGTLFLGVDLNEDARGNESRDSVGVAIKEMELLITTTAGTFSFRDFFTTTTAMIIEEGTSEAQNFYTLFGRNGSSEITGSTGDPALDRYDDVVQINNVVFEGEILSARLTVNFLNTSTQFAGENETFFDFSNGFEDFAILGRSQAAQLESANFGVETAPGTISYTQTESPLLAESSSGAAPGAPAPPGLLLAALGVYVLIQSRRHDKTT